MAKARPENQDETHTTPIKVLEHKPHRMILRRELATGQTKDGRAIEVSISGASIVIQVGDFNKENGRQFTIGLLDLTAGVLEGVGIK